MLAKRVGLWARDIGWNMGFLGTIGSTGDTLELWGATQRTFGVGSHMHIPIYLTFTFMWYN